MQVKCDKYILLERLRELGKRTIVGIDSARRFRKTLNGNEVPVLTRVLQVGRGGTQLVLLRHVALEEIGPEIKPATGNLSEQMAYIIYYVCVSNKYNRTNCCEVCQC